MTWQASYSSRSVLLVGASSGTLSLVRQWLHETGLEVRAAGDIDLAMRLAAEDQAEVVIVWDSQVGSEAANVIKRMRALVPRVPVAVVGEQPSVEQAVRFVREGAIDYLAGALNEQKLQRLLEGVRLEKSRCGQASSRYFCADCPPGLEIVGQSEGIVKALEMIRLVSESRCNPVLILGETGTGKELAARAVHAWRCGEQDNFVAVNCAALTANLLESELFGHVKGAFTGADREKTGLFELAGGGSILLDEISEMPLELQAKLLRVLQDRTFRKVGGTKDIPCKATIIASSNRQLARETKQGRFRTDLYFRLAIFPVTVPPLRSPGRRQDIPLLAEYFLQTIAPASGRSLAGLTKSAIQMLMQHDWPGNVRELRNVIERAVILERSRQITPSSLIIESLDEAPAQGSSDARSDFTLEAAEREFILRAMKETGWQRTRAAALLGITRATLHAKLKRYDIKVPGGRSAAQDVGQGDSDAASARHAPEDQPEYVAWRSPVLPPADTSDPSL